MLKGTEIWSGLFWFAFGAFVLKQGVDLGYGRLSAPGPGFAFIWLGVILIGLAAIVTLGAFRDAGPSLASLWSGTRWPKVLVVVALLLAVGFFFETLGFVLTGTLLLAILMTVIDPVGLLRAIPLALIVPYGCWWVMSKVLKVQMPTGVLAPWLG